MSKRILNLGSGPKLVKDAINVDLLEIDHPNYVKADVLEFLRKNGFLEEWDEIHLYSVLEHFSLEQVSEILFRCCEALKCGGRLVILTDDFDLLVRRYLEYKERVGEMKAYLYVHYEIFSSEEETYHKTCFVPELLTTLLEQQGFEIERMERGVGALGTQIFVIAKKICKGKSKRQIMKEAGVEIEVMNNVEIPSSDKM